ncbi:hypothetical protein NW762_012644 [Fusarium torreyae]|uniref:Arca-like protein n=1 Tax=Fusarium torreyae TaxID=1237075 RepID=A0A9W8V9J8_9HYPO|nr:hypothetical protein NW762_012644 [Fusarium torreyae]
MHRLTVAAERFHEQCVGLLLPMLHDKNAITDSAFLACSTILRFYEEISAPEHGRDNARHLLGGYAFVAEVQEQALELDDLGNAAFWVHQRQDLIVAISNHRAPKTDPNRTGLDRSFGSANTKTWAKRATCLHAEVVNFCFDSATATKDGFSEIMAKLEQWDRCKPAVFKPVLYRESDASLSTSLPDICFTVDECAMAWAYHLFSRLLMAIHDPAVPRMGPDFIQGQTRVKKEVSHYLRLLCGIASSNPVPPARTVVCLAISQCGAWVGGKAELDSMLEVLRMVEREDAWPTTYAQEILRSQSIWDGQSVGHF